MLSLLSFCREVIDSAFSFYRRLYLSNVGKVMIEFFVVWEQERPGENLIVVIAQFSCWENQKVWLGPKLIIILKWDLPLFPISIQLYVQTNFRLRLTEICFHVVEFASTLYSTSRTDSIFPCATTTDKCRARRSFQTWNLRSLNCLNSPSLSRSIWRNSWFPVDMTDIVVVLLCNRRRLEAFEMHFIGVTYMSRWKSVQGAEASGSPKGKRSLGRAPPKIFFDLPLVQSMIIDVLIRRGTVLV